MMNIKEAFIAISRAYRLVCQTKQQNPLAYLKARMDYEKAIAGQPAWLVREAERFVERTEPKKRGNSKKGKRPKAS